MAAKEVATGAKVFVAAVFALLGASFLATTGILFWEYREVSWFTIAAINSHLFIFFPTFGILALCAFFIPASVFVDLYWRKFRSNFGPARLILGAGVLAAISAFIGQEFMKGDVPAVWWLQPDVLAADREEPAGCWRGAAACRRVAILDTLASLRDVSQKRTGLASLIRSCEKDPYVETPPDRAVTRYCFVTKSKMSADDCCRAQEGFVANLKVLFAPEANRSLTLQVHAATLPLKAFFLLIVLVIGGMLAVWRKQIDLHYPGYKARIERGVVIGAFAMLLWPVSNHAFLQTSIAIYGAAAQTGYADASPLISLMFGIWTAVLVVYFFREHERDLESAAKIIGGLASVVAVLKYNEIIDYASRFVGAGANPWEIAGFGVVLVAGFLWLLLKAKRAASVRKPTNV